MSKIFVLFFLLFFFSSCGTKRQYFQPDTVELRLSYDSTLKSSIKFSSDNFLVLKNGEVFDENGLIQNFKLEKNFNIIKHDNEEVVIADELGNLKILDQNSQELYSYKFKAAVLSVALSGDDLALVLADNTMVLANRSLGIKFSQTLTAAPAQDSRVASPLFLTNILVFPSLDGKLNILDLATLKITRSVIISNGEFFNNIIYLKIIQDKMIAASPNRVVVVDGNENFSLIEEIRSVLVSDENIFIFAKNGNIIKADFKLNKLLEKKFKFAVYNESDIFNEHLYVFEKTGYLIKSDLNLENVKVYKLSSAVDEDAFMRGGKFYYSNKILNLL